MIKELIVIIKDAGERRGGGTGAGEGEGRERRRKRRRNSSSPRYVALDS